MKFAVAHFDLFESELTHKIVEANSEIHAAIITIDSASLLQLYTEGTLPYMKDLNDFQEMYMTDEDWISVLPL